MKYPVIYDTTYEYRETLIKPGERLKLGKDEGLKQVLEIVRMGPDEQWRYVVYHQALQSNQES